MPTSIPASAFVSHIFPNFHLSICRSLGKVRMDSHGQGVLLEGCPILHYSVTCLTYLTPLSLDSWTPYPTLLSSALNQPCQSKNSKYFFLNIFLEMGKERAYQPPQVCLSNLAHDNIESRGRAICLPKISSFS